MTKWIQIDPSALKTDELRHVAGVEVAIGLSPYDIPSEVCGYYNDKTRQFVIEFKYPLGEDEQREDLPHSDHVVMVVGKESGCLYMIRIDVDRLGANAVDLRMRLPDVKHALGRLAETNRSDSRQRHYKVMSEVVEEKSNELLAQSS